MDVTGEEQRIYEYMEHLPPHRSVEWNRINRRWYLEYTRWYGTICGIQHTGKGEKWRHE